MSDNAGPEPHVPPSAPDSPLPGYAMAARPRRVKRVKLALFLSSMAACVVVAIVGFLMMALSFTVIGLAGQAPGLAVGAGDFRGGALLATQLAAMNFILFFITVPAAALALGLSIGRFPYRGITAPASYVRWGAVWGAVLVGGTTFGFGWFGGAASALGALMCGGCIGAIAGAFCGFLFHAIVQPARQLTQMDVSVF
ncbi:putative lipoprotein [Hyphomonas hirschiana VP5]|nr:MULTISPECIES: hypothetical protein [Hyphomonas]KCZ96116.1 putative lipoprotein [Hyphomonas hirschiana VP5]